MGILTFRLTRAVTTALIVTSAVSANAGDEVPSSASSVASAGLWRESARLERIWLIGKDPTVARREIMEVESVSCRISRPRAPSSLRNGIRQEVPFGDERVEVAVSLPNDGDEHPDFMAGASKATVEIEAGDRGSEYFVVRHYPWTDPHLPYWYERVSFSLMGPCPSDMKPDTTKRVSCKITGAVDWSCK